MSLEQIRNEHEKAERGNILRVLVVSVIVIAAYSMWQKSTIYMSKSWLPVTATINESEIFLNQNRKLSLYKLRIEYSYNVQGIEYTGNRLYLDGEPESAHESEIQSLVIKYTPGSQVEVFYEPENPSNSAVIRELL